MKKIAESVIDFIQKENQFQLFVMLGTPTLSDPGIILIKECIKKKLILFQFLVLLQLQQQ